MSQDGWTRWSRASRFVGLGACALGLLATSAAVRALEIDPVTRQHKANDPSDWSGGITVRPGSNENSWTATIVPDPSTGDAAWLSITTVPPNFLVYALNENFSAEPRAPRAA